MRITQVQQAHLDRDRFFADLWLAVTAFDLLLGSAAFATKVHHIRAATWQTARVICMEQACGEARVKPAHRSQSQCLHLEVIFDGFPQAVKT